MAGISLDFAADVSSFLRGTGDIETALDDVSDSLTGLEDQSSDATRALTDDMEKIAREADDSADKTKRSFKDAFDAVSKDADDAGRKVGKDLEDGFDKAGQGADDFKDEAASSAREGAASFSGEFEDVADFIQETLANALSGFGPVGAAAGLAAAAGLGILISQLQASAEKAEESKQRIIDLADEIREVDGDLSRLDLDGIFLDWSTQISDTKQWFELWQDAPKTNIEQLATAADELGVSMEDLRAALQDVDGPEAQRVTELLNERLGTGMDRITASTKESTNALLTLQGALNEGAIDLESATELYDLQNEALADNAAAVEYAREATEGYNESVQDALAEAGGSWEEYTKDGIVNLDAYAAAMEAQIAAVEDYQDNMVTASQTLTDEALAYLQNMGIEAAPLLEAFVNAPAAEQQRIGAIWDELGGAAVDGFTEGAAGLTGAATDAANNASDSAPPVVFKTAIDDGPLQAAADRAAANIRPPIITMRGRIGMEAV